MRKNVIIAIGCLVLSGLGLASNVVGVFSTGSYVVNVDSVSFRFHGGTDMVATPDWGGDSLLVDTFLFDRHHELPLGVKVHAFCELMGGPFNLTYDPLTPDSWYVLEDFDPVQPMVRFSLQQAGVEERPSTARLRLTVSPRVFTQSVAMELAGSRAAAFEVYDAAGNSILSIAGDGAGRASWDGAGSQGRPMPEGVYYVRAIAGSGTATAKVVLVR
jgi:hypothetical protein